LRRLWQAAIGAAEAACDARPDEALGHAKRGSLLLYAGRTEEAIDALERSLELEDQFLPPRFELAEAYASEGKLDLAERHMSVRGNGGALALAA
jgi:tetratricopeptide (TPR) repeat protein